MKLNFQERNVVFMDFSFSLGIVWSHSSMEGKELTEKFIPVNSIQKLNKTINLSGTSSANTSKTDKWIHCFIHKTNIYWALHYKRQTKALHSQELKSSGREECPPSPAWEIKNPFWSPQAGHYFFYSPEHLVCVLWITASSLITVKSIDIFQIPMKTNQNSNKNGPLEIHVWLFDHVDKLL